MVVKPVPCCWFQVPGSGFRVAGFLFLVGLLVGFWYSPPVAVCCCSMLFSRGRVVMVFDVGISSVIVKRLLTIH